MVVSGVLATAAHHTVGNVRNSEGKMVQTNVRETSVFRKENGAWRMIGHHADALPDVVKAFGG